MFNLMKLFKKVGKKEEKEVINNSRDAAKERLHLVLMQDRANVSVDFLELMKQEIIEVIKKYIDVDESAIDVRLTNKENEDGTNGAPALYANIPIVNIKNEARKVENKNKKHEKLKEEEPKKENNKEKSKSAKKQKAKQETKKENQNLEENEIIEVSTQNDELKEEIREDKEVIEKESQQEIKENKEQEDSKAVINGHEEQEINKKDIENQEQENQENQEQEEKQESKKVVNERLAKIINIEKK